MKVRFLAGVDGMAYGQPAGIKRGDVLDLPEAEAQRMIKAGMAQPNWRDEPGPPFVPSVGRPQVETKGTRRIWEGWKP